MTKLAKLEQETKHVRVLGMCASWLILRSYASRSRWFLKRGVCIGFAILALTIGGLTPLFDRVAALGGVPVARGLQFVKVHLREGTNTSYQFVVLRNFESELDLSDYQFTIMHEGKEVERLDLNRKGDEVTLKAGGFLVLYKNQATLNKYLQAGDGIKVCSKKCGTAAWLRSSGENILRVVKKSNHDEIIAEFKYNFVANSPQRFNSDFQVWAYDQNQVLLGWRSYKISDLDQSWLEFNQFPIVEQPAPPEDNQPPDSPTDDCEDDKEKVGDKCLPRCQTGQQRVDEVCLPKCVNDQEIVGDRCLKKCAEDEFRNPETNRCNKIKPDPDPKVCPDGYQLNTATNRCNKIPEPLAEKSCPEGFFLNLGTNRCNKIPEAPEPKTCPEGSFLNPATNRCNKIAVATVKPPCPEGQLRHPETGRCRKIALEADCQEGYELNAKGNCVKKCQTGYERNLTTGRCQKSEEICQEGFEKDPKTGICTKALQNLPGDETIKAKEYNFSWLKLLNSPLSGAVVSSIIFVIYDKFFRKIK